MTNNEFILYVGNIAKSDWVKRKIMLPSVVIAQAILESGWGKSELSVNAKALFGIKKNGWTGRVYIKSATEQRPDGSYYTVDNTEWRAYDSWEQSIIDHNTYIATRTVGGALRYERIIGNTDYEAVCELLRTCGYATSLSYPEKLIRLIEQYNLTQFDTVTEESDKVLKICISAGHGINTAGKRITLAGYDNTREWTLNSRIANKFELLLSTYNCEVLRVDDTTGATDVSNTDRAEKSNEWGADVYISIHHNAGVNGGSGGGTLVFFSSTKPERKAQAQSMYDCVVEQTGLVGNRSYHIQRKGFTEIAKADAPSFLIENGFMDSTTDVPIILTEAHADKTAVGLVNFLVKEFGLTERTIEPTILYKVQCGAFIERKNAEALRDKLVNDGYEAVIVSG